MIIQCQNVLHLKYVDLIEICRLVQVVVFLFKLLYAKKGARRPYDGPVRLQESSVISYCHHIVIIIVIAVMLWWTIVVKLNSHLFGPIHLSYHKCLRDEQHSPQRHSQNYMERQRDSPRHINQTDAVPVHATCLRVLDAEIERRIIAMELRCYKGILGVTFKDSQQKDQRQGYWSDWTPTMTC